MVRFIVKLNERKVNLFKIREVPNCNDSTYMDLNISFSGTSSIFLPNKDEVNLKNLICVTNSKEYQKFDSHISVHCNPGKESVTIKRTIRLTETKEIVDYSHVTPGIKRDKLFIPVIFRICGDLDNPKFELEHTCSDEIVLLPIHFDAKRDQLRYMLVISERGVKFPQDIEHPSNVANYTFNNFELTIIYSLFNMPPHAQSINVSIKTTKEQYEYLRGFDWWEIYNIYTDLYMKYAEDYFEVNSENDIDK